MTIPPVGYTFTDSWLEYFQSVAFQTRKMTLVCFFSALTVANMPWYNSLKELVSNDSYSHHQTQRIPSSLPLLDQYRPPRPRFEAPASGWWSTRSLPAAVSARSSTVRPWPRRGGGGRGRDRPLAWGVVHSAWPRDCDLWTSEARQMSEQPSHTKLSQVGGEVSVHCVVVVRSFHEVILEVTRGDERGKG